MARGIGAKFVQNGEARDAPTGAASALLLNLIPDIPLIFVHAADFVAILSWSCSEFLGSL